MCSLQGLGAALSPLDVSTPLLPVIVCPQEALQQELPHFSLLLELFGVCR